jgi:protein-tyrosine kinase
MTDHKMKQQQLNKLPHGQIILQNEVVTNFPAAERFRILRAKIERNNLGKTRHNLIAITSAVPEEGKSVTAVNLSRSLSIDPIGKTLIVDCDLRKPAVHLFFNLPQDPGLSDVLLNSKPIHSVIKSITPRLDVITAGSTVTDPTNAIEQPELATILDDLKKQYRYIIIDCPPALLCPEPITISSIVDSTILVVRAWRTNKHYVEEAVDTIGRSRIMGIVINDIKDASKVYDYYGYYGGYKEEKDEKLEEDSIAENA